MQDPSANLSSPGGDAVIPGDGGEQGAAVPPAGIPADLSSLLLSFSQAIAGPQEEQTLAKALSSVMASCNVDSCYVWRIRRAPESFLEVLVAWDRSGEPRYGVGERVQPSSPSPLDKITPDKPLIAPDGPADPRFDERLKRAFEELGVRSLAFYPLVERGEVFGVLDIRRRTQHNPAPGEVQFFRSLAQVAAIAILQADSQAEVRLKVKQLRGLYSIAERVSDIADPKAIMQKTASLLLSEIGYLNCYIGTVDAGANILREEVLIGVGDYPGRPRYNFPLDATELTAIAALRASGPTMYDDVQQRAEAEGWGQLARDSGVRSMANVPLRAGGKVLGVMAFGSKDARISDDELSIMGAFANQLASTLARVEMNIEREKQIAALEQANTNQARLLETVRELSTPVIPVHEGILVLPIVGMIDTSRSAQIMESLLNAIQKERALAVIIDITGVPTVDTSVANHLLRSTRAASLLGAMCVLVGVAPAVAQTLTQIGVDFGDLVTRADLQAGIAYALKRLGRGGSSR